MALATSGMKLTIGKQCQAARCSPQRHVRSTAVCRRLAPSPARGLHICQAAEYEALAGATVYAASSDDAVELRSLWNPVPGTRAVVVFLTHFADLSTWEVWFMVKEHLCSACFTPGQ